MAGGSVAGGSVAWDVGSVADVGTPLGSALGSGSVDAGPAGASVATVPSGVSSLRSWVTPMMATPAISTTLTSITVLLHRPPENRVAGTGRSGRFPWPPVTVGRSPPFGAVVVTHVLRSGPAACTWSSRPSTGVPSIVTGDL